MAHISFENVGILAEVRQTLKANDEDIVKIPFGVKTPLSLAPGTVFLMNYTLAEQIADNLKNVVSTNFGERVGLAQFGANLMELLSEFVSIDDFNTQAMARIKTAAKKWMPYVELKGYEAFPEFENGIFKKRVKLLITYRVPTIPELAKQDSLLEVELRAI
jgi:phage baseplate assembly protein W